MIIRASLILLVALCLVCRVQADAPALEFGTTLRQGAALLDVGTYATPTVVDWNNDQKKDLIVGQHESSGKIRLYLNEGSDQKPSFYSFSYLRAKSQDITTPAGT